MSSFSQPKLRHKVHEHVPNIFAISPATWLWIYIKTLVIAAYLMQDQDVSSCLQVIITLQKLISISTHVLGPGSYIINSLRLCVQLLLHFLKLKLEGYLSLFQSQLKQLNDFIYSTVHIAKAKKAFEWLFHYPQPVAIFSMMCMLARIEREGVRGREKYQTGNC